MYFKRTLLKGGGCADRLTNSGIEAKRQHVGFGQGWVEGLIWWARVAKLVSFRNHIDLQIYSLTSKYKYFI